MIELQTDLESQLSNWWVIFFIAFRKKERNSSQSKSIEHWRKKCKLQEKRFDPRINKVLEKTKIFSKHILFTLKQFPNRGRRINVITYVWMQLTFMHCNNNCYPIPSHSNLTYPSLPFPSLYDCNLPQLFDHISIINQLVF